MPLDDDADRPDHRQPAEAAPAHLCRGTEALLSSSGTLPGFQAERHAAGVLAARRRKISGLAEGLRWRGQDRDGRGGERPDPRNCHEPPRHLILLGLIGDLGIELDDLCP